MIRLGQRGKIASPMDTARSAVIRLLVADDHPLVRQGVVAVVSRETDMQVVGEAGTGLRAVEKWRALRPDVTIMDLGLPEMSGITAMKTIRADFPRSRFIALTVYEGDEDIDGALKAGAQAYLLKSVVPSQLVDTIRAVHAGLRRLAPELAERLLDRGPGPGLTAREVEVLRLMASGQSNLEIARTLQITKGTAKWFVSSILSKLGADDRTEAVTTALERGILHR
jgi:DNA-binding NarL/FixJ family response regulator